MDQNKLKKICQKALDISYQGITISDFQAMPTQRFSEENNKWIPDSYTLFIMLKKPPVDYKDSNHVFTKDDSSYRGVENFLESLIGFEVCVDFV